jgi:isopentenyl-diphosphate delta-isomerase type 1
MKTNLHERFDVVDEQDRVIGSATRAEVHARKLLHRAVHGLVFSSDGRVIVQLRSAYKDKFPNRWCTSVSGHVDAGEDYDTALRRELTEELGIPAEAAPLITPFLKVGPCAETDCEFIRIYHIAWDGPVTPPTDEVASVERLLPDELDRRLASDPESFTPSFRLVWQLYREHSASFH